jgi:hypothetical protein
MAESPARSVAQPGVVLGLTFLLIGLTFALPYKLIPESVLSKTSENMSLEVANVYAVVAWAGWAHFLFAFRGQSTAFSRSNDPDRFRKLAGYGFVVALAAIALFGLRWLMGTMLFSAIVWVYFIDHFIKAEQTFEGTRVKRPGFFMRWLASYQPLITFAWLSAVLLNVGNMNSDPWLLWSVSLALAVVVLVFGGWRKLTSGDARGPLLCLFFIAEALVWGTYSQFGGPMFLTGVYVFHIAAGSYFHYLGSYFYANAKSRGNGLLPILAVNAALIGLGLLVVYHDAFHWLTPVLGIEWFTLWVGLHLVSSDVFPYLRARTRVQSSTV